MRVYISKVHFIQTDIGLENMVEYALPDEFDIYDMNRDGQIEYEEFVFTLMSLAPMQQPEEMRGPFLDSDLNSKQSEPYNKSRVAKETCLRGFRPGLT